MSPLEDLLSLNVECSSLLLHTGKAAEQPPCDDVWRGVLVALSLDAKQRQQCQSM
jgi:hypothetical protein